jgi:hypothetical protein
MHIMNINIGRLAWELSVLQRAVSFPSLSAASRQIGISQPQLSRILFRIEEELKINLLDRRVKRVPRWTKEAHLISQAYRESVQLLEKKIRAVGSQSKTLERLSLATLEGLSPAGMMIVDFLFKNKLANNIKFDVLDLNELTHAFEAGEYDLIISSQRGGRRKCALERRLGYQVLEEKSSGKNPEIDLKSSTESMLKAQKDPTQKPLLISNSLMIRRMALEKFSARGIIPSPIYQKSRGPKAGEQDVMLLVRENLPDRVMEFLRIFAPDLGPATKN